MTHGARYRLAYSLTLDEQVEDLMLAWKSLATLAAQRKLAVMMGVMMAMLLYIVWQIPRGGIAAVAAGAIAGFVLFATVDQRMRRAGRRFLTRINGGDAPTEVVVELSESEAVIRRPDDEAVYRWSGIRSVTEDPEMIRLLTRRYSTINLPKRAFRSSRDEEECLAFIRQRLSMNGTLQA